MPYGTIKVDNVIYTKGGVDTTITVSGIVDSLSGAISVTGAISGASVSATTGTFTTLSGNTTAGTTATFTSGVFTTFSGTTVNVVSGVFASGTVALPSVSVGTSGNGLYSPGANQLAISTSGTGRLTVDNLGNVNIDSGTFYVDAVGNRTGVNNTSPGSYNAAADDLVVGLTGDTGVTIASTNQGSIFFADGTTGGAQQAAGYLYYLHSNDSMGFGTANTLRMTLDASGNLGLGVVPVSSQGRSIQFGTAGALESEAINTNDHRTNLTSNAISITPYANAYKYLVTGASATMYRQLSGVHQWFTAPTGTAGNAITFTQAMTLDASGNLLLGTTTATGARFRVSPDANTGLEVLTGNTATNTRLFFRNAAASSVTPAEYQATSHLWFNAGGTQAMTLDASGNLLVGLTTGAKLSVSYGGNDTHFGLGANYDNYITAGSSGATIFRNGTTERARIDSSGRLLVGTTITGGISNARLQVAQTSNYCGEFTQYSNDAYGSYFFVSKSRGSLGNQGLVQSNDEIGVIGFSASDGTAYRTAALIQAAVDGTTGASDIPGRLVFSTTADGEASPTPRMRISSTGGVYIGKDDGTMSVKGVAFEPYATTRITTDSTGVDEVPLYLNRQSTDGALLKFFQANTEEGDISVSGTTVSYNGAHLSRWSQLPSGAERIEILRGSVLSNIDEMCEWGEEDNEQLNRMKVSDVEGDKNVAGVFQGWDDDDNTYTNDFYCAMTGDFIIRIGAGVTVERGDLLMSAGDGTAKPQDDDIIRSKTIAKVTSTNVTCTYDDGSYCVPCVLMAC